MHEFSIAQVLVETACEEADRAGATRVVKLVCRIGPLTQVVDWSLEQAFEVARAETVCESAMLEIEKAPVEMYCPHCRQPFSITVLRWDCPQCQKPLQHVSGGDELDLIRIEAEKD